MDPAGYLYRLYQGYLLDAAFYAHRPDLSPEAVAAGRTVRMLEQLPTWMQVRRELSAEELPYAYHNYKGKCLADGPAYSEDGQEHPQGLTCGKDHAHEREVVAAALDPLATRLSQCGRALRIAVRKALPQGWTLWNQADLAQVLEAKAKRLRYRPGHVSTCPCGAARPHPLAVAKVDAAQFFKCSSTERAVRKAERLFRHLARSQGTRGVAVRHGRRPFGCLCKRPRDAPRGCRYIPVEDVLSAMRFCAGDRWFVVGDQVVERERGWPMGGPVSSPCTSLDLETAICRYYRDPETAKRVGWTLDGYFPEQLVQGLLHVDDAIAFSKVFCCECLFQGIERLWPEDVGVSLEGSGGTVPFLHVEVQATDEATADPVRVVPLSHNRDFAQGAALLPAFAKLPPYVGQDVTKRQQLAQYMWSRVCSHDQVLQGDPQAAAGPVAELVTEAVRLQWPTPTVAAVLRALPRTHTSDVAVLVRRLGSRLKHTDLRGLRGRQVYEYCLTVVGECLGLMWARAGVVV